MLNRDVTFPTGFNLYAFKKGNEDRIKLAKENVAKIKADGKALLRAEKNAGKPKYALKARVLITQDQVDPETKKIKGAKEQLKLLRSLRKDAHSFTGFRQFFKEGKLISTEKSPVAIRYDEDKALIKFQDIGTYEQCALTRRLQENQNLNRRVRGIFRHDHKDAENKRRKFEVEWKLLKENPKIRNLNIGYNPHRDNMTYIWENELLFGMPPTFNPETSEQADVARQRDALRNEIPTARNETPTTTNTFLRIDAPNPQNFIPEEIVYINRIIGI